MKQRTIFDLSADPLPSSGHDTSDAAARNVQARESRAAKGTTQIERVYEALRARPRTDEELERDLDLVGNSVRPRRRKLVLRNRVRDSGLRRPTRSGGKAIVWEVTPCSP